MRKRLLLTFIGLQALLAACSAPRVADYAANQPRMDIRHFFDGDLKAVGSFFTPSGKASPQFTIAMKGNWNGDEGTLREHFVYNDGFVQDRMWNLHLVNDYKVTATAADAVGTAIGEQSGNAFNMRYTLSVPSHQDPSSKHEVAMNDWIFLMDDRTAINRIEMSKFGFTAGQLVISIQKQ